MRRTPPSVMDRGARKFSLDAVVTGDPVSSGNGTEFEAPTWGAFRQKIFSFVRSRSKSPVSRSPGSKSPGTKSPTGFKSPFSISPSSRSPASKSPASKSPASKSPLNKSPSTKSPTRRSPSIRSPTTASPRASPSVTPPLKSPPAVPSSSAAAAAVRRSSFSKASKDSRSSSGETEFLFAGPRRSSVVVSHNVKKGLGLTLKRDNTESFDSSSGTPGTASPGTPVGLGPRRSKGKLKQSPGEFMDLQKMDDDLRLAEAALRPRKWSYHGTASPSTPVEAPKRHSFSTASDHKSGIVVSNNDLAKLLGQNRLLLPGFPLRDMPPLPVLPNPKARGRSQSIAVCAQSNKLLAGRSAQNEPVAPVTIRTTDCDHLASIKAHDSIDSQKDDEEEDPEKLLWDSSGSTVNVNLLGSMIEKYLKVSAQDEGEEESLKEPTTEESDTKDTTKEEEALSSLEPERHSGGLSPPAKGLQVK